MDRIKVLVLVVPVLIYLSCNSAIRIEQKRCADFRTGRFHLKDNQISYEVEVVRDDSLQVEKDLQSGYETIFAVKWLEKCKYQLDLKSSTNPMLSEIREYVLIVEIDSIVGKRQYFTTFPKDRVDMRTSFYMTKEN